MQPPTWPWPIRRGIDARAIATDSSRTLLDPAVVGALARAWLDECDQRPVDVRVFRALRAAGFDPAVASRPVELPAVPRHVLREALAAWSDEALEGLAARIATAPDTDDSLTDAAATVRVELASRTAGGHSAPGSGAAGGIDVSRAAAALAELLGDAGATDAWLRAGGRAVAGWGRIRRRFPALLALELPAPPPGGETDAERAFAATLRGDAAATDAIADVDAALGAPWFDGLLLRADLAEAAGQVDAARGLLTQAMALAPSRSDAAIILADLEAFEGDDEAALAALEPWRRHPMVTPRRAAALLRLGRVTQATGLGLSPAAHAVAAPTAEPTEAPSLDALLDEDPDPHARAAALQSLGHGREHAEALAALMGSGDATEREVIALARWIAGGGAAPTGVDPEALASRVLASTGAALPGASGLDAAESAALAAALLDRAGQQDRAAEARAIRRQVLDRTLQDGGAGPALAAALMDAAADALERGSTIAWSGRRSWILRFLRTATPDDAALVDAAARLVGALRAAAAEDARAVADAALAVLPLDDVGVDALPAAASRAAFRLLAADVGRDVAVMDPRFQHAASRRVASARELAAAGRLEEAATIAAAVLRKPLLPEERAALVSVLVDAAASPDTKGAEEAQAALVREAAGLAELARRDWDAAAAAIAPMVRLGHPGTLRAIQDRLLAGWSVSSRYPRVAAAVADVLGRAAVIALQSDAPDAARAIGQPLLDASPYLLARALVAGRLDTPPPRVPPRSPLPLPLLEAMRTGAPLLTLARLLRRKNWDPADVPALLTA